MKLVIGIFQLICMGDIYRLASVFERLVRTAIPVFELGQLSRDLLQRHDPAGPPVEYGSDMPDESELEEPEKKLSGSELDRVARRAADIFYQKILSNGFIRVIDDDEHWFDRDEDRLPWGLVAIKNWVHALGTTERFGWGRCPMWPGGRGRMAEIARPTAEKLSDPVSASLGYFKLPRGHHDEVIKAMLGVFREGGKHASYPRRKYFGWERKW